MQTKENRKNIIWNFQRTIETICDENNLVSLSGSNSNFIVNGREFFEFYTETTRKGQCKYSESFDFRKNLDDLIICSDEIMYFLANMCLYLPYINNPLNDGYYFNGGMVFPNKQNMEAKRYNMFANIVSEKLYNFWDRLGDLIATYFPDLIEPKQVFFAKVIEIVPKELHVDPNYGWLKDFKEKQYFELNKKRKKYVHYQTEDTSFKHEHLKFYRDREEIFELMKQREGLVEFYKEHLELTFIGLEKTLLFIVLITEKTLQDIE